MITSEDIPFALPRVFSLTGEAVLESSAFVINAKAHPFSGVYFLLLDAQVMYVGQSLNVFARLTQHREKPFNRFAFIPARSKDDLDVLESYYTYKFNPTWNGRRGVRQSRFATPITKDRLYQRLSVQHVGHCDRVTPDLDLSIDLGVLR